MQTLRRFAFTISILAFFIISNSILASPPHQDGTTTITPENAQQVAEIGRYGNGLVVDLALSPDDTLLAIATTVNVSIIDLETYETVMELNGHTDILTMLDWSNDGRYIVAASKDQIVRVYLAERGELVHEFGDFSDAIEFVTFSPDSSYLLVGGARRDHTMRLYNIATGDVVWQLDLGDEFALDAIFSPDGESIVGSVSDYSAYVWNSESGRLEGTFGIDSFCDSIMLSADSGTLLVLDSTHLLSAFDFNSGDMLWKTERDASSIYLVGNTNQVDGVLLGTTDGTIQHLSMATGELLEEFGSMNTAAHSIAITAYRQTLFVASSAVGIHGYDLATSELVAAFDEFTNYKGRLPFNTYSATYFEQNGDQLAEYSVATGDLIGYVPNIVIPADSSATVLQDNETILIETRIDDGDGVTISQFVIVGSRIGDILLEFTPTEMHEMVSASPNAQFIAVVLQDGTLEVWNVETGEMVILPSTGSETDSDAPNIGQVLWSPNSQQFQQLLVTYLDEATILLWDVVTGTVIRNYEAVFRNTSFIWWEDGSSVAYHFENATLRIWRVDSGDVIMDITLEEAISSMSVSPNYDLVAIGTELGNIMLVDIVTGNVLQVMDGHVGSAFVSWSYDGALIRSMGSDYVIHLWGIPTE